ncbi:DUF3800 domain-containing protein [Williamsoniiplasma luminosum]|uniref:DUF3800 domain-containing protein n=1 Tax=Williamsoniiplasma luminosum TaxID=214888 RepID=A0A2S0NKK1_9MOLU|nr:DUF3800 domain-containing protein [Williamsoniiplasma luminosum]AVP49541.1 MAG: hypothetical protein C5T88_03105 [Williamsoniiplasma luminosum]
MRIVIDESGNYNLKKNKYFIIAGFITGDKTIDKLRNLHKKLEKEFKIKNMIDLKLKYEIKANNPNMGVIFRAQWINAFLDTNLILPFAIKIDISKDILFQKKESEKFNYALRSGLEKIMEIFDADKSYFDFCYEKEIYMKLDSRNIATDKKYELEGYLKSQAFFLKTKKKLNELKYFDSATKREIQIADFFAHYFWSKFNYPETDFVTPKLSQKIDKAIIVQSPFNVKELKLNTKIENEEIKLTFQGQYSCTVVHVIKNFNCIVLNNKNIDLYKEEANMAIYKIEEKCTITHYFRSGKVVFQGELYTIEKFYENNDLNFINYNSLL